MNDLFDSDGAIYMGSQRDPAGCRVGLFGVPYDGTTSFRPGTRFGPAAIREVSPGLESYCPQLDRDLEELAIADLGAVDIPFGAPEPVVAAVKQATEAVLGLGLKPLMLGGGTLDQLRGGCRRSRTAPRPGARATRCPRGPAP